MAELIKYTHDQKMELAGKINKIKNKEELIIIFNLISKDPIIIKNNQIMENSNGVFMLFNKLSTETYIAIEQELKKLKLKRKMGASLITSSENRVDVDTGGENSSTQEISSPQNDRLSNREKNLIKRRKYDKNINMDSNSDVIYTQFDLDTNNSNNNNNNVSSSSSSSSSSNVKDKKISKVITKH